MKILDKIQIYDKEYTCIQILYIDDKKIYKLYDSETDTSKFVEEKTHNEITNTTVLDKIKNLTCPKTDIIVNKKFTK